GEGRAARGAAARRGAHLIAALAHVLRDPVIGLGDLHQFAARSRVALTMIVDRLGLGPHLLRAAMPIVGIIDKHRHIPSPESGALRKESASRCDRRKHVTPRVKRLLLSGGATALPQRQSVLAGFFNK